jgi:glycosyltransferase involved in cell wall biosynthesis
MTRPLHIAIDARWIFPEISGIGLYTHELIGALVKLSAPHRFTLIFNNAGVLARTKAETGFDKNSSFAAQLVTGGPYSPMDQFRLPRLLKLWNVDVYHATNIMMPLVGMGSIKRIVTIHDLIPLLFRDHAPRSKKNQLFPIYRWLMHNVARKADMIIAVSDHTRHDVVTHLLSNRANPGRIQVIHEGVRPRYVPAQRTPRDHVEFLFVGRRDPYKNLPMLINSFHDVRKQGLRARLHIVGGDDPRYPEARAVADELGVNAHITWSGYVPESELIAAYQQADVFVLPSKYEGFGLPVLEAMACGTPVICSNTSSLPEVAGDAALLIDPANAATLTDAMARMVREPALRSDLTRRALIRAAAFTWEKTARQTIAAYETV